MSRRVVVTGLGVVSPLGVGQRHVWDQLVSGVSGIRAVGLDRDDLPCTIAGVVPEGDAPGQLQLSSWIEPHELRRMDRFIALGFVAAQEAVSDAALDIESQAERVGVFVGSGIGGLPFIERNSCALAGERGYRGVSPFFVPGALVNLAAGYIGMRLGAKGPNLAPATACTAGAHAIGEAFWAIKNGRVDVVISGGAESTICPIGIAGFASMKALSRRNDAPQAASRPWDKDRDGFVMGEGAASLVLEDLEHAKARGAKIYAELVGYGATCDAHHITSPSGEGALRSMQEALRVAEIKPSELGYINAHGTSTPPGDIAELHAVEKLFLQAKSCDLPLMSSTKSSTGHLLGASGALEAFFSVMALREQVVPGTLNLEDPEVTDLNLGIDLVPLRARPVKGLQYVLSNSFGFGGTNGSLLFKAWEA